MYIGITSKDETERWKDGFGYRTQPVFFRGIVESGWNNFKHEVLFEGLTQGEALDIESSLIKKFASNNIKYGYNVRTISEHPIDQDDPIIADLGTDSNFRIGLSNFFDKWVGVVIPDHNIFKKRNTRNLAKD